jgi:hypothetical protein
LTAMMEWAVTPGAMGSVASVLMPWFPVVSRYH